MTQFEAAFAGVSFKSFVSFHPGYLGLIIGSYKLLHNSNSIHRGQYRNAKHFGCDKIPESKENETVLVSPPATPTKF